MNTDAIREGLAQLPRDALERLTVIMATDESMAEHRCGFLRGEIVDGEYG